MEVICCSNTTRLLSFPELKPINTLQHPEQNVPSSISGFKINCFQRMNKTSDPKCQNIEYFKLKKDDKGTNCLEKLLGMRELNLSAATCGKNDSLDYALGYSCGTIKLYNLRKNSTCDHKFIGDIRLKAAVTYLDYSSNNEYLASVYENGIIDIFGLKTKIKCHTIILDKNSAVAKFNPAKRFFLNVASISGAVTVYDINTKKIYFQQKDAHSAPCRDLIVPFEIPERLLSAGYDSTIKIFDTRIKRAGMDIKASCGFSTIDTTPCGRFFVVGNLKGEIISYDMRNINSHFATFQAEKSTINKVLIVNNSTKDCSMMPKESSSPKLSTEPLPTTAAPDFFNEVMSHQRRVSDFSSNFQSRISMISNRESTCSRISDNFGLQNVGNMLNDLSDGDMPSFSEKIPEQTSFKTHKDNHINSERLKRSDLPSSTEKNPEQTSFKTHEDNHINSERLKKRTTHILDVVEKPRSTKRISLLENINEETTVLTESDKENNSLTSNSTGIDKKQELAQKLLNINQVGILKSEARKNANELIQRRSINSPKIEITNATSIDNSETDGTGIQAQLSAEMKDEFGIMRTEMNGKISELYQLINFDMAGNTLDLKTYIFNVKRELQEKMKMVEECVGMLMLDNPVINQVLELQEENRNLRKQLSDVMRR